MCLHGIDTFVPLEQATDQERPATPECAQDTLKVYTRVGGGGEAECTTGSEADTADEVPYC